MVCPLLQPGSEFAEVAEFEIGTRLMVPRILLAVEPGRAHAGLARPLDVGNGIIADVQVGNHTVLANNATLAGHVHLGDWVIVGGLSGIHQFCHVGAHAMLGFQSHVSQDVPPYMTVSGNPLVVHGHNAEGLRRRGFSRERITRVKQMHRLLYRDGLTLEQARAAIAALQDGTLGAEADADVQMLLDFLAASTRGIAR